MLNTQLTLPYKRKKVTLVYIAFYENCRNLPYHLPVLIIL